MSKRFVRHGISEMRGTRQSLTTQLLNDKSRSRHVVHATSVVAHRASSIKVCHALRADLHKQVDFQN